MKYFQGCKLRSNSKDLNTSLAKMSVLCATIKNTRIVSIYTKKSVYITTIPAFFLIV